MTSPSTLEKPVVREARAADTAAIAILLSELGYPVTDEVLSVRLQKMPSAHCTFIAELEGAVAGFVGCLRWTSTRAIPRSAGSWLCRCRSAFGDAVSDERSFLVWSSGAPMLGFGISAFTAGSSAETLMPSMRPAALSIPDAALRNL